MKAFILGLALGLVFAIVAQRSPAVHAHLTVFAPARAVAVRPTPHAAAGTAPQPAWMSRHLHGPSRLSEPAQPVGR